jgi:hypothetical protein
MSMISSRFAVAVVLFTALAGAACARPDAAHPVAPEPVAVALDPASPRAKLAARREQQIARLHAYAESGIFPRNYTSSAPLHMLKDPEGRLCAVANLAVLDGHREQIDALAMTDNDLLFAEIEEGPLAEWILGSGLTKEEIARIQAPAPQIVMVPPEAPQPQPQPPQTSEPDVVAALQDHFRSVEQALIADTEKSLDVAMARLEGTSVAIR